MERKQDKKTKGLFIGSAGSLGFLSLAGACGGACSAAALPLGSFLASVGLGGLSIYLPQLRIPLFIGAVLLSIFVIYRTVKRGRIGQVALVTALLAGGMVMAGVQVFQQSTCDTETSMADILLRLTPSAQKIIKSGVYPLWLELGHAPSVLEVKEHLMLSSEEEVIDAFRELNQAGWEDTFDENEKVIKRVWPLSSTDHGITVRLEGSQAVFARCAVDALGMSAMFGKPAHISVTTPLERKKVEFDVSGGEVTTTNSATIVSYGSGCDDILFFSSKDEFESFKQSSGKSDLQQFSLQQAVDRGKFFFGSIYGS